MEEELKRVKRISDQMVTGHRILASKYNRRNFIYELFAFLLSTILVSLVFIDLNKIKSLLPTDWEPSILLGSTSVLLFFLSIVNLLTNWKTKAWQHNQAADQFFSIKQQCANYFDACNNNLIDKNRIIENYKSLGSTNLPLPDAKFLKLKSLHLRKIAISKHLDTHPHSSITLLRIKLWLQDNALTSEEKEL